MLVSLAISGAKGSRISASSYSLARGSEGGEVEEQGRTRIEDRSRFQGVGRSPSVRTEESFVEVGNPLGASSPLQCVKSVIGESDDREGHGGVGDYSLSKRISSPSMVQQPESKSR